MSDVEKQSHHDDVTVANQSHAAAAGAPAHHHHGAHIPQIPVVSLDAFGGRNPNLRQLANPAPLGLFSFASTTLVLSLINAQTRGVTTPNVVVGMALATGGLAQLLAGMWEFACGNTFGATAFSSYGAFWISFAFIFIPGAGILEAYTDPSELENALGYFLLSWFIFTFFMLLGSLRSNAALIALFFFLDLTFLLLFVGKFYPQTIAITKAGGIFGCITAFIAYYVAASGLIHSKSSYFNLPVGEMPKRDD